MHALQRVAALAALAAGLAGCNQTTQSENTSMPGSTAAAMRTGSPQDEQACIAAVAQQTNNTVTVLSSEFSEANTLVMVGVGPNRAPWRCLVSRGIVSQVMSMVNEGAL